jgi:hypothetical protein
MTSVPVVRLYEFLGISRSYSQPHVCLLTGQCEGMLEMDARPLWRTAA